jgi:hypothetical protein
MSIPLFLPPPLFGSSTSMIDTRDKRASVVGLTFGWMVFAPLPTGALASLEKRRQVAHQYAGPLDAGGTTRVPIFLNQYRQRVA